MTSASSRRVDVAPDHPAFAGHFPGHPLWPGVLVLAEVMEAVAADPGLAAGVGPTPQLTVAKFLAPVRPGACLDIRFAATGRSLAFEVFDGERRCASGQLAWHGSAPGADSGGARMGADLR